MGKRRMFLGSKRDIEAARKKGVQVTKVEQTAGTSLGALFTDTKRDKEKFVPRHQAIPCRIIVINASGTFVCHEINSQELARGVRFQDAVNLGGGTPAVGDQVLVSIDAQGNPIFFFDDAADSDFDIKISDFVCLTKRGFPNTTFAGETRVNATRDSSTFTSEMESFVEFTSSVDLTTISPQNRIRLAFNFQCVWNALYTGAGSADFNSRFDLNVGIITSSFTCATTNWNNKPSSVFVAKWNTGTSGIVESTGSVDDLVFTNTWNSHMADVSAVVSSTLFGYHLYFTDNTTTPVSAGTYSEDFSTINFGTPSLISFPPGGKFG